MQEFSGGQWMEGGGMRVTEFEVDTSGTRVLDITSRIRAFVSEGSESGLAHVFLPHATAGLALIETGSGSEADLEELLDRLLPRDDRYVHRHGSRGHGGDHLLPALVSPSLVVPVDNGELVLGTWQSVVIVDPNRDNDRRRVRIAVLPG
jgi:secondary thiamine-phosphate synthase enzyme